MCMMNGKPVGEYNSPCGHCPEYLCTCSPLVMEGYIFGECDLCYCEFCPCYDECMSVGNDIAITVSAYNEPTTTEVTERTTPISKAQYRLMCRLIRQKHISRDFFYRLLFLLYDTEDWKSLDYDRMYRFIGLLIHSDRIQR